MKEKIKLKIFKNKEYQKCIIAYPFRIFFNLNGDGKTPKKIEHKLHKDIPDYILGVSKAFYQAYEIYIHKLNLKNPIKEGIYYDKGARFIDILIKDIPVQKGLVSAELIDNSDYFMESELKGKSIKIQLHNDLMKNTATPIHELFHVFQYNYCNFNNMWFMEGLARWSQNLIQKRKMVDEQLPQNIEQLDFLLSRAHDVEYFFRKLLYKVEEKREFVKEFLTRCEIEDKKIQKEQNIIWSKEIKKSDKNNKYILLALIDTINKFVKSKDSELKIFIQTVEFFIKTENEQNTISTFFVKDHDDLKQLESVDIIEGDLIIEDIEVSSINSFNRLKKVNTIKIKNNNSLKEINGFNGLEYIQNIEISNNGSLENIYGFFKFFSLIQTIDGYIKIESNKNLTNVKFLKGIRYIGSSFYLHNNNLESLEGLDNLENVGASLSLSGNNITSLKPLQNLKSIEGMLGIAYNNLTSLEGLENLKEVSVIKWNEHYRSLALQGNKNLYDISALSCKSITDHLIIYMDTENSLLVPESSSEFYNQSIDVFQDDNLVDTQTVFHTYIKPQKTKILFHDTWIYALKQYNWFEPCHMSFSKPQDIIMFIKRHGIKYAYGQTYRAQKFLFDHEKQLKDSGLKFIVNNFETVRLMLNKKIFYEFMEENGLDDFIPKLYKSIDEIKYPCISKQVTDGGGDTATVVNKFGDIEIKDDFVVNEYILGDTEYATNIFFKDEIIYEITYKKIYNDDVYVLNHDTKYEMKDEKIECPFKKEFTDILKTFCKKGEYISCCIDYKIKDDLPKILEINVRFGYTLARYEDDFKSMMGVYMKECDNV